MPPGLDDAPRGDNSVQGAGADLCVPGLSVSGLSVSGLSVFRGERLVLRELSFAVPPGGALLLSGPNGAGKSTLLRVLAGLKRPDAGTVSGADSVAYLGHGDAVKAGLTPREMLGGTARGSEAALRAAGLAEVADVPGRMLSAGQKRRVAFARVAASGRLLWLLDEPSLGLDERAVGLLAAALAGHRASGGMVVAATHVPLPLPHAAALPL